MDSPLEVWSRIPSLEFRGVVSAWLNWRCSSSKFTPPPPFPERLRAQSDWLSRLRHGPRRTSECGRPTQAKLESDQRVQSHAHTASTLDRSPDGHGYPECIFRISSDRRCES